MAFYATVEILAFRSAYPDAASRSRVAEFQDNPAVRMLQGVPDAAATTGGYVVWDAGWFIEVVVGIWAILVTSRMLRGEEESDRIGLVLAAPVTAARATRVQLLVLVASCMSVGASIFAVMATRGTGFTGSLLFGLGITAFATTFVALTAVLAQVFGIRRRVVGAAAVLLGGAFVVRMVANSTDGRAWLRWFTPFGWFDELHPYGADRWPALVVPLLASILLSAAAMDLRRRRDTYGALLSSADRKPSRLRLLGGPTAFAWRSGAGVLSGWAIGIAAYSFVIGILTSAVADFAAKDPNYRKSLETLGMDMIISPEGYIALMGQVMGLIFALFACWRIGAARAEEAAERADLLLTRPLSRWWWLGGHAVLVMFSAAVLALVSGVSTWAGAMTTGADVSMTGALASTLNTLPAVALSCGVALLTFGVIPRLTVAVPVAATVGAYLLELIGPTLDWPEWTLSLSPFHHLAYVPWEPFATAPALTLIVVALLVAAAGIGAFQRRDIVAA